MPDANERPVRVTARIGDLRMIYRARMAPAIRGTIRARGCRRAGRGIRAAECAGRV